MSTHETHADLEAARQIDQSAHESQAFERSDAAKVAAVAAVYERWIERSLGPNGDEFIALVNGGRRDVLSDLRKALADPDAALERVRAEARAEALRDAADAMDGDVGLYRLIENRMLASEGRDADAVQDIVVQWLRARDEVTDDA